MNHTKTFLGLALASLVATGCSSYETQDNAASGATAEDYQAAVLKADASIASAVKINYEWRDSKKILKKAAKAAKTGDYDKALKLANKAAKQGDLAIIQAGVQKNAGPL